MHEQQPHVGYNATSENATQLAAITVSTKIPEFWTEMPRLWFAQVESILAPQKQSDETKYNIVVAKIGREALQQVSDILLSPPPINKYQTLKDRLLQVFEESAERQFQKLVGELELGTQKPSQLLRRMRELGRNSQASEKTLHSLWMSRLPANVRAVLTVSQDQNLDNLAQIADKIIENTRSGEIAEVNNTQVPVTEMLSQLHKLSLEVASLREEVHTHRRSQFRRGRGRGYGNSSHSRTRSNSRSQNDPNWLCRFHYKFRNNAKKCEKPCAWKETTPPSGN